MSAPRFTTNRSPADGHLPADWATTSKRGTIRMVLLIVVLFVLLLTVGSEAGRAIVFGVPA